MHGRTQVILTALAAALALVLIAFVLNLRGKIEGERRPDPDSGSSDGRPSPRPMLERTQGRGEEGAGQTRSDGSGAEALLVRGRVYDAESGEPLSTSVSIHLEDGREVRAESGGDGVFHAECEPSARALVAVERTREHFGLQKQLAIASGTPEIVLPLVPCRSLPVVLLDPGGAPLRSVVDPPHGALALASWPSLVVTDAPLAGSVHESERAAPELCRVGRWQAEASDAPPGCEGRLVPLRPPPYVANLVLGDRVLESRRVKGGETLLEFRVDPALLASAKCSLSLRVLDQASGQPPAVHLGLTLCPVGERRELALLEIDDAGRVEIEDLPAGAADLRLEFGGYEHQTRTIELLPGQHNDLGDVLLAAGACIAGSVTTSSGEPVAARLWCARAEGREQPVGRWSNMAEGSNSFAACSLPRGSLLLGLDDGLHALNPIQVDTSRGSLQNLHVEAKKGDLLRLAGPYSSGAAHLRLLDEHGLCLWSGDNLEHDVHELCLLPGRYSVEVLHADARRTHQEFELGHIPRVTLLLE